MSEIIFTDPSGVSREISSFSEISEFFEGEIDVEKWMQGNGTASVKYCSNGCRVLLVCPELKYGVFLKYLEFGGDQNVVRTLLSLNDRKKLESVVEYADECFASEGLFLSAQRAWHAVDFFVRTGKCDPGVDWVSPAELPDGGNW